MATNDGRTGSTIPTPPDAPPSAEGVAPADGAGRVGRSRTSAIWIGAILAAIVLVLLLVFILQNTTSVTIHYFGFAGTLPIAVALLLAAVLGLLLVAIPGTIRIMQLRKVIKRSGNAGSRRRQ